MECEGIFFFIVITIIIILQFALACFLISATYYHATKGKQTYYVYSEFFSRLASLFEWGILSNTW